MKTGSGETRMDGQPSICVRLLGPLLVLSSDGAPAVGATEFRTAKTRDLFRILALNHPRSVRVPDIVAKLWPDASTERACNSLRTALSMVRKAVGHDCIVRSPEGLSLLDARTDAGEFLRLGSQARQATREGNHERVLSLTAAAEGLYVDDFHADDDDSDWARNGRWHLKRTRLGLLRDAAESAIGLGLCREARDFAAKALTLDESSEAAVRALMRAHVELGETPTALRVYECYRTQLAEDLSAEPGPATRELHLRLLRGTHP